MYILEKWETEEGRRERRMEVEEEEVKGGRKGKEKKERKREKKVEQEENKEEAKWGKDKEEEKYREKRGRDSRKGKNSRKEAEQKGKKEREKKKELGFGWEKGDEVRVSMFGWGKDWYPVMAVESRRGRVWEDLWLADYRELPKGVHKGDEDKFRHENPDLQEWMVGRRNVIRVRRNGTEMKPVEISGPRIGEQESAGSKQKEREREQRKIVGK